MYKRQPVEVASRRANRVIAMRDGRNLSFAEAGDPEGFPVLCFFGIGGSRYLVLLLDEVARQLGLRVISPDRPGFGRSSAWSDRAFADFARDIDTLCATLSLRRVALWGYSVGCAYAAVCALSPFVRRRLVGRLTLVSPWVPLSAPGVPLHFTFARFFPNAFAELLQPGSVKEQREQLRQRGTEAIHTGRSAEMPLSAPSTAIENFGLRGAAKSRASSPKTQAKKKVDDDGPGRGVFELFLCGAALDEDDAFGIAVLLAVAPFEPLDEGVGRRLDVVLGAERDVAPARRVRRDPGAAAAERQRREEHAA